MKNEQKQRLPSWIDLPLAARQSNADAANKSNSRQLRSAELAIGRVAMIGAIVLTLRHKQGIKRQDISVQVARGPATAIEIRKVKPGQGI